MCDSSYSLPPTGSADVDDALDDALLAAGDSPSALLVVDVQRDFCEGGSLAVSGGATVASRISEHLARSSYPLVVASRDWHLPGPNDGHISLDPDFVTSWPPHCVQGTPGAEYHPALDLSRVDLHLTKGEGEAAYSMFEGRVGGRTLTDVLSSRGVATVVVVGLATDHCVRATALDALRAGFLTTVLTDLVAGVDPTAAAAALSELKSAGAHIEESK